MIYDDYWWPRRIYRYIEAAVLCLVGLFFMYWYITFPLICLWWLYRAVKLKNQGQSGPALTKLLYVGFVIWATGFWSFGPYVEYQTPWTALALLLFFLGWCIAVIYRIVLAFKTNTNQSHET